MTSEDQSQFARRIRAGLPVLGPHAARILRACEDPAIDFATLAARLGESPSVAARLVGMANSSFYCRGQPVSALPKAVQILGLVTARGIALGLTIGNQFPPSRCPAFAAVRFWETAVLTAQLARLLAPAVPPDRALTREATYMAGLLHNMGLLALVSLHPAEMDVILAAGAAEPARPLGERLRDHFGFDHRQVAGWIAEAWHLPAALRLAMEHCDDPDYRGEAWALVLLTGLCARRARGIIADATGGAPAATAGEVAGMAALGLDAARVAAGEDRLREALAALRATAEAFVEHAGQ